MSDANPSLLNALLVVLKKCALASDALLKYLAFDCKDDTVVTIGLGIASKRDELNPRIPIE